MKIFCTTECIEIFNSIKFIEIFNIKLIEIFKKIIYILKKGFRKFHENCQRFVEEIFKENLRKYGENDKEKTFCG